MTKIQIWIACGVGFYMLVMLFIGWFASRKIKDTSDFILAGRRLPWWMTAASLFATWFGAETCMGASGMAYEKGFLGVIVDPFGAALCLLLYGLFFVKPLRELQIKTLPDFYEKRFGKPMAWTACAISIPVYIGWVGAQLMAFGIILESLTGIPRMPAILIGSGVVITYTYLGGMLADAIADFWQTIVIVIGFVILFFVVYQDIGGFTGVKNNIPENFFHLYPRKASGLEWLNYLQAWTLLGLGSLAGQDLIQRSGSTKTNRGAALSSCVAGLMYLTIGLIPVLLGIFGRVVLKEYKGESILIDLAVQYLNPVFVAVLIGALLAAIMSTADSAILAPASIIGNNVIGYFRKNVDDQTKFTWCRRCVPIIGVISLAIALYAERIYTMVQEVWALGFVSLTAPLIAGIYWKRATPQSAFLSALAGCASWLGFTWAWPTNYPSRLLGFLVSCVVLVLVSSIPQKEKPFAVAERESEPIQEKVLEPAA